MTPTIPKKNVLGVDLALLDYRGAVHSIEELTRLPRSAAVSFCNTHLVAEAAQSPAFQRVLASFDLNFPDGMPLVWTLNKAGANLTDRVYGPYLMRAFFEPSTAPNVRHFLLGSTLETLEALSAKLLKKNPQAQIVGQLSPPFRVLTDADNADIARKVNDASPDCIWIAMGGVKQETWIAQNIHRYPRGVFLAVGDAFTLLAGQSKFAPAWMQRVGLTWLYRLCKDPSRLASRYFRYNGLFLFHLLKQRRKVAP